MGIRIQDHTFFLKGLFETGTKAELGEQINAAGGKVSKSMTLKTNFVVCGTIHDYYLGLMANEAAAKGIPMLDETQLSALLAGQEIELENPAEKPPHQGEALGNAFSRLQDLCAQTLTDEVWHQICLELDQCDVEAQAVGADLVTDLVTKRWEERVDEGTPHERRADRGATADQTPCFQPTLGWIAEILRGLDHPKFRIVRELTLFDKKLTGKSAAPILECKNLCNVEVLNLEGNKLSARFWRAFADADQFGAIKELSLAYSNLNQKSALALGQPNAFPGVWVLELGGPVEEGFMTNLLGQGAFGALKELNLMGTQVASGEIEALLAVSMPDLRILRVSAYTIDVDALVATLLGATHLALDELNLGRIEVPQTQVAVLRAAPQFANTTLVVDERWEADRAWVKELMNEYGN